MTRTKLEHDQPWIIAPSTICWFHRSASIHRNRALLRRLLKEHVADDTWQQLAKRVIEHLEMSGFKIDEGEIIMRKRDRGRGW